MTDPWPIAGHNKTVRLLHREIASGQLAHAYLFAGPPQIGKRTLAFTFAQALLCGNREPPCNDCDNCKHAARHLHPDLLVIDFQTQARLLNEAEVKQGALKIETIRIVQRDLALRPLQSSRKVIIIPNAQLLTTAAANALLKTLEEPPAHALLLLTAPEADDLLPTIVSRCRVIPLHLLSTEQVREALIGPPWQADPEQADLLAHLSGGRIGWAIRALQDADVLDERRKTLDTLQQALAGDDVIRLRVAEQFARQSNHGIGTLTLWSTWWRDLLLRQSGAGNALSNVDREHELAEAAEAWATETTHAALTALQETVAALERNANPRLAWEAFLLTLPRLNDLGR